MLSPSGNRFVDVCLIVRNLYKEILDIGIVPTPPVHLKQTLIGVVARHVTPGEVHRIDLEPKNLGCRVWGMLRRYEHHSVIAYKRDLNICWTRYVVCKELAHLLIDTDHKHFTSDPIALAEALLAGIPNAVDAEIQSEYAAGYAAVELLIPWCLRRKFDALVQEGLDDRAIAEIFKCPAIYVSLMRGKYGTFSRDANNFNGF